MVLSTSNDVKEKINIHWFDSDPNWKIFWICFVINCFFFNHSRKNYADEVIQNTLFWSKIDALCSSYVVSNDTNITCEWGHNLDKNPEIKRNHQQKHRSTGEPTTHSKLLEQTPESESLDILEMHIQCVNWSRKQISASPTGMEAQEMVRWVGRFYGRWKERISYFTWSQCVLLLLSLLMHIQVDRIWTYNKTMFEARRCLWSIGMARLGALPCSSRACTLLSYLKTLKRDIWLFECPTLPRA